MSNFNYTYDALGRRTLNMPRGPHPENRLRRASRHGQADRNELASAKRYTGGTLENPTNPVYSRHFIYDYDPIGNRESYQIGQGTATTYTSNELNQYTATADPSESFTHDDDGNLTQDGTFTYVWDAENRLVEIRPTSPGTNAIKFVYDYDYLGRRARRTQYGWTGSAWSTSVADQRIYLYDRWNNIIIYDADNDMAIGRKLTWGLDLSGLNGNPTAAGIHGAGGIGGLVAAWAPGSPAKEYFCFYDANGNLSDCLKNSDGTRWSHFEYDPYGGQLVATDPGGLSHQFRYSTKFYQAAFGIYDFGRRYLHPKLGRWMSRDPLHEHGGVNLFVFVANNPISLVDPLGLEPGVPSTSQPASQPCEYCGPDITSWFATELNVHAAFWRANQRNVGALLRPLYFVPYASSIPYKWMRFTTSNCPAGKRCKNTVMICDTCIHKSELGNIMFGAIGKLWMRGEGMVVGGAVAYGGTNSLEDIAGVAGGLTLGDPLRAGPISATELCTLLKANQLAYIGRIRAIFKSNSQQGSLLALLTGANLNDMGKKFVDCKRCPDVAPPLLHASFAWLKVTRDMLQGDWRQTYTDLPVEWPP